MKTQPTCLTSFVVFLKDYGCSWKLNPGWRDLLARRSGSNSSRRVWINVLRPLEFVNSPSKEAIDAMVFICFARVCFDPQELPYTTHLLLARLLELIKNSQELCHLGRRPTYSKRFDMDLSLLHRFSTFWCCTFAPVSWSFLRHLGDSLFDAICIRRTLRWRWNLLCNNHTAPWVLSFRSDLHCSGIYIVRGFCKPIAPGDHIGSIWWSSNGSLAFGLFPRPFFFKSFFFTDSIAKTSSKFSITKLSGAGAHGRCRKYHLRPLRYVCSEPRSYSLPLFFFFPVCRKKCFRSFGDSALEMLFKFSSVLYFSKYHDSGRLQAAYSFSCFQGPCRLWRYLFLLLYMWQSTLALLPLSLLRLVWLNFCLPFSGPCSQDFLAFSLSRAEEVFMPL